MTDHTAEKDQNQETPMTNMQQNPDGSWTQAKPLPYIGWKARTENWCRRHGLRRIARLLAAWDERGLGR